MNNTVPSVVAAARLVQLLAASGGELTAAAFPVRRMVSQADAAAKIGISASTCYRILQSLSRCGWVVKDGRGWSLGDGLLPVALSFRDSVARLDTAISSMRKVSARHRIACKISIRRGLRQIVVARAEPDSPIQAAGREGASFAVSEGSSGAALLADEPEKEAVAICRACSSNAADRAFLKNARTSLSEKGWCVRDRIQDWPLSALSAPLRDQTGKIFAALTFIVPEEKASDAAIVSLLLATARECEKI